MLANPLHSFFSTPPARYSSQVKTSARSDKWEALLDTVRKGNELFHALERRDPSKQESLRALTPKEVERYLIVQALIRASEYPSRWEKILTTLLGRGMINGVKVRDHAVKIAEIVNPAWHVSVLVHELNRARQELFVKGDLKPLSTYDYNHWLQSFTPHASLPPLADTRGTTSHRKRI